MRARLIEELDEELAWLRHDQPDAGVAAQLARLDAETGVAVFPGTARRVLIRIAALCLRIVNTMDCGGHEHYTRELAGWTPERHARKHGPATALYWRK